MQRVEFHLLESNKLLSSLARSRRRNGARTRRRQTQRLRVAPVGNLAVSQSDFLRLLSLSLAAGILQQRARHDTSTVNKGQRCISSDCSAALLEGPPSFGSALINVWPSDAVEKHENAAQIFTFSTSPRIRNPESQKCFGEISGRRHRDTPSDHKSRYWGISPNSLVRDSSTLLLASPV